MMFYVGQTDRARARSAADRFVLADAGTLSTSHVFFLWLVAIGITLLRWRPSVAPAA